MNIGPIGVCDTHIHFYDDRYQTSTDAVLFPPNATPAMYSDVQRTLGIEQIVVVQPTTYGTDNRCQLDGMRTLRQLADGADMVRGVMVVDADTTLAELTALHEQGVRGARFHMLPGGAVPWTHLEVVADRINEFGWHIQLQLNGRELAGRLDRLLALPTEVVIDHVGRFMPPVDVSDPNFSALVTLLEHKGWVKLSAPYESSVQGAPYPDVSALARALAERVPERLLWATNWPHPGRSVPPSVDLLSDLVDDWLPTQALQQQVLSHNPRMLYDFPESDLSRSDLT